MILLNLKTCKCTGQYNKIWKKTLKKFGSAVEKA